PEDSRWEVGVEGNDFYTTYVVGEGIYEELRRIDLDQPALASRVTSEAAEWIEDLNRKVIIRLTRFPRRSSEYDRAPRSSGGQFEIEEIATKTTPTCLSSYLS
ncbi:MAG: hypothetical protein MK312_07415, partial [Roseibacillus sp.]|nr:hypothetical protein [Roseibacillus sp.]